MLIKRNKKIINMHPPPKNNPYLRERRALGRGDKHHVGGRSVGTTRGTEEEVADERRGGGGVEEGGG
jgi:hypothetical protein